MGAVQESQTTSVRAQLAAGAGAHPVSFPAGGGSAADRRPPPPAGRTGPSWAGSGSAGRRPGRRNLDVQLLQGAIGTHRVPGSYTMGTRPDQQAHAAPL